MRGRLTPDGQRRPHRGGASGLAARIAGAVAVGATLLAASAPAHALFSDDEARRALIELRGRFDLYSRDTNRRLDDLTARLDALATRAERLEQLASGQLDLTNQIAQLQQELARLRGQLEVQTNELAQTQRSQRDLFADLDTRVRKFEPVTTQIDGKTATVDVEERRRYEAALGLMRAGEFGQALTAFQQFRTRWPDSAYTANVLFWIGSAQFAVRDYRAAIATHQQMVQRHPDHPRVPDALLNIGLAQAEAGDRKSGRATLQGVIDRYPDSTAAQQARDRLPAMR